MQIHGLQPSNATQAIQRPTQPRPSEGAAPQAGVHNTPVDTLELSAEAQQILQSQQAGGAERVDSASGIRVDKVAEIRRGIADGSYESPEKMSLALDRLLDTFA